MENKGKPGGREPGIDPANKKRGPRTGDTPPEGGAARTNGTSTGGHGDADRRRVSAPAEPPGAPPARPSNDRDR